MITNYESKILKIKKETPDCYTFRFKVPENFNYITGQFVMVRIHPKETNDWKVVTGHRVYNYLKDNDPTNKDNLAKAFNVDVKAIENSVRQVAGKGAVKINDKEQFYAVEGVDPGPNVIPPITRAYSMSSIPSMKGYVETMIKTMPGGFLSHYLTNLAKEGDPVVISGPYGEFGWKEGDSEEVVLLGAGSGITPLMGIARYVTHNKLPTKTTLIYSSKTPEDIVFKEEFAKLEQQNPNLTVVHTITRSHLSKTKWEGRTGRIDADLVKELVSDLQKPLYFICGPLEFGKVTKQILIGLGVAPERIKMEAYG